MPETLTKKRMTAEEREEARQLLSSGSSVTEVAKKLDVSAATIYKLKNGNGNGHQDTPTEDPSDIAKRVQGLVDKVSFHQAQALSYQKQIDQIESVVGNSSSN